MSNKTARNYLYLLEPSALSLAICLIISIFTWVGAYSSSTHRLFHLTNVQLQQYAFWRAITDNWTSIIGSSAANTVTLWTFWLTIGILVYMIIYFFISNVRDLEEALEERNYIWPDKANHNRPIISFLERAAIRLALFIIIVIFAKQSIAFVLTQSNAGLSVSGHAVLFVQELLLLHIGVVLLRLFSFKARVIHSI